MLVMGLVLGQSLMVISTVDILLYAKVSSFIMYYGSALLLFTRKLHCYIYITTKDSLHVFQYVDSTSNVYKMKKDEASPSRNEDIWMGYETFVALVLHKSAMPISLEIILLLFWEEISSKQH